MIFNYILKFSILLILTSSALTSSAQWTQVGQDIYGSSGYTGCGNSVSLNSDASRMAVDYGSKIKIFENLNESWLQLGNTLDTYGHVLSLSDDGGSLVIGYSNNSDMGPNYGAVFVYHYISGSWILKGDILYGQYENAYFGQSIDISNDGSVIAVGMASPYTDSENYGRVAIFSFDGSSWEQVGNDIVGDEIGDGFGYSISIDSIGTTIVVGSVFSNGVLAFSGQVQVFENISNNWIQIGNNLIGNYQENSNRFGQSVSISDDGVIIAIGERYNVSNTPTFSGRVTLFKNISDDWIQIGDKIIGDYPADLFGQSISLNCDGSIVVIGAPYYNLKGQVKIFKNVSDNWVQIRQDLYGEYDGSYQGENFGRSVDISSDGYTIAVGHPYNDEIGNNYGKTSVYHYSCEDVINYNLIEEDTICPNESVLLDAGSGFDTYLWNTGETTQTITVNDTGYYHVTVSGFECGENIDSIQLKAGITPIIQLISDTAICHNSSIEIDAGLPYSSYAWSTGESEQLITVSDSGYYSVTVTAFSCSNSDSVHISINELPNIELAQDTLICPYDTIVIDAGIYNSYLWSTGSEQQSILANTEGIYSLTVTDPNNCANSDTINLLHSVNLTGIEDTIRICLNGNIAISANPINTNTWNLTQNTDTINYLFVNDTTFFLQAVDTMFCVIHDSVFLKVDSNFIVPTWIDDTILTCYNNELTIFCNPENENIWNSVLYSDSITYIAENDTVFYLQAINSIGCQYTDTVFINQDFDPYFTFDNTSASSDTILLGDTLYLIGDTSPFIGYFCQTEDVQLFLPDVEGIADTILISSDGSIEQVNDIKNICINMEHSFAGDLEIFLTCPNGQSLEILGFQNNLGSSFLGEPVDPDNSNTIGTGYDYCFTSTTNKTLHDNISIYSYIDNDGNTYVDHNYILSGDYLPTGSFGDLLGCPINGNWILSMSDNLLSDNGYIFSWSLNMNRDIPVLWEGENIFSPNNDTTYAIPNSTGWQEYTYSIENEYGCVYDTLISVYIDVNISVNEIKNKNIELYPNPASQKLTIQNGDFVGKSYSINIYNPVGKLVYTENSKNSKTVINVREWAQGIYIVAVEGERIKFVKQ